MKVIITKPARTATQSGTKNTKLWQIDFVLETNVRYIENIMGWTASNSTGNQIKLYFADKEAAIKYARSKNWDYQVIEPQAALIKKKSYADNFV